MLSEALGSESSRLVCVCGAGGKTTLIFALAREFVARGERVLITTTTRMARDEAALAWRAFGATSTEQVLEGARRLWASGEPSERGAVLVYRGGTPNGGKLTGFAPELVDALSRSGEFDRIIVEADGSARKPLKAAASHEPVIAATTDLLIAVAGLNGLGLPLNEESVFRAEIWARLTGSELGSPVSAESIAGMALHPDGFFKGRPPGARSALFLNRADSPEREEAARRISDLLAASGARGPDRVAFGALLDAMRDRRH